MQGTARQATAQFRSDTPQLDAGSFINLKINQIIFMSIQLAGQPNASLQPQAPKSTKIVFMRCFFSAIFFLTGAVFTVNSY